MVIDDNTFMPRKEPTTGHTLAPTGTIQSFFCDTLKAKTRRGRRQLTTFVYRHGLKHDPGPGRPENLAWL